LLRNGLYIVFTDNFSLSPKAFIGDPMFLCGGPDIPGEIFEELAF
jgi:hypothetical protein